eukprot:106591_1
MDKVHIYYYHSYEFGHKEILTHCSNKDDHWAQHKLYRNIRHITDNNKFNSNILHITENHKYNSALMDNHGHPGGQECIHNIDNKPDDKILYSFGYEFSYDPIYDTHGCELDYGISQKYVSLKDEVTRNPMSQTTVEQFNFEYQKAKLHHAEYYRKRHMPKMLLHHILAVMIYCNYDSLQYEFSSTYRPITPDETIEHIKKRHSSFYWLGQHLKEAVSFGTSVLESDSFFHGINQELTFPQVLKSNIRIYSPLSTSLSYCVAVNFSMNSGLIVEFGGVANVPRVGKYFPCSWLSDYPNEQECLFIQSKHSGLKFVNITSAKRGKDFDVIINALKLIDYMLSGNGMNKCIELEPLAIKILEHQLSVHVSTYPKINSMHYYAQTLINSYCKSKSEIKITSTEQTIYQLLFTQNLHFIFPNLKTFVIAESELQNILSTQSNLARYLFNTLKIELLKITNPEKNITTLSQFELYQKCKYNTGHLNPGNVIRKEILNYQMKQTAKYIQLDSLQLSKIDFSQHLSDVSLIVVQNRLLLLAFCIHLIGFCCGLFLPVLIIGSFILLPYDLIDCNGMMWVSLTPQLSLYAIAGILVFIILWQVKSTRQIRYSHQIRLLMRPKQLSILYGIGIILMMIEMVHIFHVNKYYFIQFGIDFFGYNVFCVHGAVHIMRKIYKFKQKDKMIVQFVGVIYCAGCIALLGSNGFQLYKIHEHKQEIEFEIRIMNYVEIICDSIFWILYLFYVYIKDHTDTHELHEINHIRLWSA